MPDPKPNDPHLAVPDDAPAKVPSQVPNDLPPAGPHADPDLTDDDKTPGAGTLPPADDPDADATSG